MTLHLENTTPTRGYRGTDKKSRVSIPEPTSRVWYAPLGIARGIDVSRRIPRAGLGQALAIHVAKGFGTRRARNVLHGFTHFLETYNEELYNGEPSSDAVTRRLAASTLRWWRSIENITREQNEFVERTWARLSTGRVDQGDATVPECVLFLRAAVGAGALAADVPEQVHDALDRFAIGLGLAWEAAHGMLTAEGWHAGRLTLGIRSSTDGMSELPPDAGARAQRHAREAIASLPQNNATALLVALLDKPPLETHAGVRKHSAYIPYFPTLPKPLPSAAYLASGLGGSFAEQWRPRLEDALGDYAASDSSAFRHATAYLMAQRGKRIRGLLTLAAAAACGHDPARALASASAVEWLHQASLVIDDIIDRADMRRGSPALHDITSPLFAVGVTAFLLGRRIEGARNLPSGAAELLLDAELSLLKGECLELCAVSPRARNISAYYRTIDAKTARLFSCAASLGAIAGESPSRKTYLRALAKYGREVGLAFQIIDDLRDYAGDSKTLGKRVGTDFDNGIATLPLLLLQQATDVPTGADFEWIRKAMTAYSIPARCLDRAKKHIESALLAIKSLPDQEGVDVLWHIAETTLVCPK